MWSASSSTAAAASSTDPLPSPSQPPPLSSSVDRRLAAAHLAVQHAQQIHRTHLQRWMEDAETHAAHAQMMLACLESSSNTNNSHASSSSGSVAPLESQLATAHRALLDARMRATYAEVKCARLEAQMAEMQAERHLHTFVDEQRLDDVDAAEAQTPSSSSSSSHSPERTAPVAAPISMSSPSAAAASHCSAPVDVDADSGRLACCVCMESGSEGVRFCCTGGGEEQAIVHFYHADCLRSLVHSMLNDVNQGHVAVLDVRCKQQLPSQLGACDATIQELAVCVQEDPELQQLWDSVTCWQAVQAATCGDELSFQCPVSSCGHTFVARPEQVTHTGQCIAPCGGRCQRVMCWRCDPPRDLMPVSEFGITDLEQHQCRGKGAILQRREQEDIERRGGWRDAPAVADDGAGGARDTHLRSSPSSSSSSSSSAVPVSASSAASPSSASRLQSLSGRVLQLLQDASVLRCSNSACGLLMCKSDPEECNVIKCRCGTVHCAMCNKTLDSMLASAHDEFPHPSPFDGHGGGAPCQLNSSADQNERALRDRQVAAVCSGVSAAADSADPFSLVDLQSLWLTREWQERLRLDVAGAGDAAQPMSLYRCIARSLRLKFSRSHGGET